MKANKLLFSLLQVVVGLLFTLCVTGTVQAQQVIQSYTLDRKYNMAYLNSMFSPASFGPYSGAKDDIGGIGDNPSSGLSAMKNPNAWFISYVPYGKDRYISNIIFATKPNEGFEWHTVIMIETSGSQFSSLQGINAFTGEAAVFKNSQASVDYRVTTGFSFHPSYLSSWTIGANLNVYESRIENGSENYNTAQNAAVAATLDFGVTNSDQDEDGLGTIYGFRLKNFSFSNKFSALKYSPGDDAVAQAQYGMTRYIPAYLAAGGSYRFALKSEQQITVAAEVGLELNHAVPDAGNMIKVKAYESRGALNNMFGVSGGIGTLHCGWLKNLGNNSSIDAHLGLIVDTYSDNPYLSVGWGHERFNINLGYLFSSNANPLAHQLSLTLRMGIKGD